VNPRPGPFKTCAAIGGEVRQAAGAISEEWLGFRERLSGRGEFSVKRGFFCLGAFGLNVEVFEQFLDNLQAPFGLLRFNIDNLQGGLVVDRVGGEITKIANGIDGCSDRKREYLLPISFVQDLLDR